MKLLAFLITIIAGLFFLVGLIINKLSHDKKALYIFSISLAAIVMLGLIGFDLVPELLENIASYSLLNEIVFIFLTVGVGFLTLKVLDIFIPHHHHDHKEAQDDIKDHNANIYHIGLITSIALILHNIIEGGTIYLNSLIDLKIGLFIALGVGLHNIPLGMEIATTLNLDKKPKRAKIIPISLITLSTSFGALLVILIKVNNSSLFISSLIGITIGMLTYLIFFELLKEIKNNIKNKYAIMGMIIGALIIFLGFLI